MSMQPKRTHAQELVELKWGRDLPEILHDLYVTQGKTQEQIAAQLGVTRITARQWLIDFEIKRVAA